MTIIYLINHSTNILFNEVSTHALRLVMRLKHYWMILVFVLISFAPHPLFGNEIVWRSIGLGSVLI